MAFFVSKNVFKISGKNTGQRLISSFFISRNSSWVVQNKAIQRIIPVILFHDSNNVSRFNCNQFSHLEVKRFFSKKKGSKRNVKKEDEESESESDEEQEEYQQNIDDIGNIITKPVASLRLDTVLKAGLSLSKKKVEQEFYAFKLRVNGSRVTKKSMNVHVGDELDHIQGFSPDTSKYLVVNRVIIKGLGEVTGTNMLPVKMEILKELVVDNYEDPWNPSSLGEIEK